jgi:hypothetical protein
VPGSYNAARLRRLNDARIRPGGEYVLYWMQASRRLRHSHALDYALLCCEELGRPLVVYEGLRHDYPWASRRLHRFVLEGMRDNASTAERLGIAYWPFVGTPEEEPGRGLLRGLAGRAALVVTDDFPCFIAPEQSQALARSAGIAVFALDGNGLFPLAALGEPAAAAAHLRPRLHRGFADAWKHQAREQLEAADTHDPIWNAAQRELVATGAIHNYLRMLWGKKVLEWSRHPELAYRTLVHLNNKYALDGRDPNSWSGILWCFGLFDRPWAPERPIFGRVRYMSSRNTARKFRLDRYLRWAEELGAGAGRPLDTSRRGR